MKVLVEDLVVTFDEIKVIPGSALISPGKEINYWFVAVNLLAVTYLLSLITMVVKYCMKHKLKIHFHYFISIIETIYSKNHVR